MRYATAGAFRAALEERLRVTAEQTGVPLVRLRKLVVFDRLIARLTVAAPDQWVLKGAVALQFRLGPQFRTTRDLDLGRREGAEAAMADFVAVQSTDLGDHFSFRAERTAKLDTIMEGAFIRYHVAAELAGRRFEDMTVDVAPGDPLIGEAELLRGPDLLGFADIPAVEVPVLPLEQHIAEKLHAYTRDYGADRINTRVKDLIDVVLIGRLLTPRASLLTHALDATFRLRATHPLPHQLPPPPGAWRVAYARMAAEVGIARDMERGLQEAREFLEPVLKRSVSNNTQWDPSRRTWLQVPT